MQTLKSLNIYSFLVAARGNRPNEKNVSVPTAVVESFLSDIDRIEAANKSELIDQEKAKAEVERELEKCREKLKDANDEIKRLSEVEVQLKTAKAALS